MAILNFNKLHQHGAAIADDPETCVSKLNNLHERLGITEFVLVVQYRGHACGTIHASNGTCHERGDPTSEFCRRLHKWWRSEGQLRNLNWLTLGMG